MKAASLTDLPSDIKIVGDDLQYLTQPGAVECSAGVTSGTTQYPDFPYWRGAFVPGLPWRPATDFERDIIIGGGAVNGAWIRVLSIPSNLIESFDRHILTTPQLHERRRGYLQSSDYAEALRQTTTYLAACEGAEIEEDTVSIDIKRPGLPTTTAYNGRALLGLHIDSCYDKPIAQRFLSPFRCNINVGLQNRYFLYINTGLLAIEDLLKQQRVEYREETHSPTHAIRTAFMKTFKDIPVIKVLIRPGYAYIAPTENIIHDGCTLGQRVLDVQYSVRGVFPSSRL